ncbi:hypothetical protein BX666DRAFT_1859049 [Dichotomocladium elegans]|nr:hypothetical protein BX666DRAFT_1859049 [Dichotomocladium elegans]
MPLKRKYLAQSRTIQNVFVAGMLEKMVNEIGFTQQQQQETQPLATLIAPNPSASCLPGGTSPVSRRPPCQQQVPITASVSTSHHSFSDSNIMIHDRMDMLEQEIHKMKRKAKRRAEDLQLETQQLEQKIVALETWKVRNERSRKSERLWILMGCVTVLVVLWIIRT